MKKHEKKVGFGQKLSHFMKHYFGSVMLALLCAFITVVTIGYCV